MNGEKIYDLWLGTNSAKLEHPLDYELPKYDSISQRFHHCYIIGKTGKGKSSLMENMALYDINYGAAVMYFDPSGMSCRKLYHQAKDKDRIIYISIEKPRTINPINKEDSRLDTTIQEFIQILDVLVTLTASNPESTVMMQHIIQMAIRSIIREEDKNIQYINKLLMNKSERRKLTNQLLDNKRADTEEYRFWNTFDYKENWQYRDSAQRTGARLSAVSSGEMEKFVVGKNDLDLQDIVDNKKVVLVDTSRMNRSSRIYLTNMIVHAALSFAEHSNNRNLKQPKPLMMYVDEFSIVVSDFFAQSLLPARQAGVGFTIAHQNFSQIKDRNNTIVNNIISTVDTLVTFSCGLVEAKQLSPWYDCDERDLLNLDPYTAFVRIGKNPTLTELYPPILDFVPPLPGTVVSPEPAEDDIWFLSNEPIPNK